MLTAAHARAGRGAGIVLAAVVLLLAAQSGCEEATDPFEYRKEVVVNATLVATEAIPAVDLTWSGRLDETYSAADLAIGGALVVVSDARGFWSDTLVAYASSPGHYVSVGPFRVQPRGTYTLTVRTPEPDVRIVTGTTSVPDTFRITYASFRDGDTIRYDPDAPLHSLEWSPSGNFASYLPTIWSLDPDPALIPKAYYGDTASASFKRPSRIVYRIGLPKAQTHTDVPWLFLNYYGRTRFDIYAADENLTDFLSQWLALQTGELKEIRYKLHGGIGLFCSKSRAKNGGVIDLVK